MSKAKVPPTPHVLKGPGWMAGQTMQTAPIKAHAMGVRELLGALRGLDEDFSFHAIALVSYACELADDILEELEKIAAQQKAAVA